MNTEPVVINTVPEKTQTQLDRFKAVVGDATPVVDEKGNTIYWFYKKTGTTFVSGMVTFPLDEFPIPSMIKLDSGKFEENAKALVEIVGETGFCTATKDNDLNSNIVRGLTSKSTVNSFIVVFTTEGRYAGICTIKMRYENTGEVGLNFYIDYLCSIVPGTGTLVIRMIQDAIENACSKKCKPAKARWVCAEPCIVLHVVHDTAIGFYLKRGFRVSSFSWAPGNPKDVPLETYFKPKGGKRTTRRRRRKSRKLIKMDF